MNSASIAEVVVRVCLELVQDIDPPANIKLYADVDLHELMQPSKSVSECHDPKFQTIVMAPNTLAWQAEHKDTKPK